MAMAAAILPLQFRAWSRSDRRLAVGLGLSLLLHGLLAAGVRPVTSPYMPARPLQVEMLPLAQTPDAQLARSSASTADVTAPAGAAPRVEAPENPKPVRREPGAVRQAESNSDPRLPLDRYYTSREVDVRAEPLNFPALVYPQLAYQMRVRGKVVLRILIDEHGNVNDASVLESQPPQVFDAAALAAARALQFSPALRHGHAVKSQKTIEVVLDPYESIHIP